MSSPQGWIPNHHNKKLPQLRRCWQRVALPAASDDGKVIGRYRRWQWAQIWQEILDTTLESTGNNVNLSVVPGKSILATPSGIAAPSTTIDRAGDHNQPLPTATYDINAIKQPPLRSGSVCFFSFSDGMNNNSESTLWNHVVKYREHKQEGKTIFSNLCLFFTVPPCILNIQLMIIPSWVIFFTIFPSNSYKPEKITILVWTLKLWEECHQRDGLKQKISHTLAWRRCSALF